MDTAAVDPNPDGSRTYGVGDPTITKVDGTYYLYCDRESREEPYRVVGWSADSLDASFRSLGEVVRPREDGPDYYWDNHRVQDADVAYVPDLDRYVMVCNMMDRDGIPGRQAVDDCCGGDGEWTRVVGFLYSGEVDGDARS